MTPALRLSFSLLLSLLLWLPSLPAMLRAGAAPEMIALRYLLALIVARVGVGLVFRIVNGYAEAAGASGEQAEEPAEETGSPVFGRRQDDWVDSDLLTEEEMLDEALDSARDTTAMVH